MTTFGNIENQLKAKKKVICPLCHKDMVFRYQEKHNTLVFACDIDRIMIAADDPLVGKWEERYDKLEMKPRCPMPSCDTEMRFFCTSTGYMKFKCPKPKCAATLANPVAPDEGIKAAPDMPPEDITMKPTTGVKPKEEGNA